MKQNIRIHKAEPNKGALDFSHLLDAPAGKHGFVQSKNGHLYFADGTRARFLGFNIAARSNTPDHATAEKMAERFASMGVNFIRLHAADAPISDEPCTWSSCREAPLLDYDSGNTRHFHPEGIDRFDYFFAKLKEKGIYLHIDLLVARPFIDGDELDYPGGFPSTLKRYPMYNERLIELREIFCREGDRAVSMQSAKESMVLLKNEGVLPIKKDVKKIALIGPHADSARKFFGGYTHLCMMESTYAAANSIAGVNGSRTVSDEEIMVVPGTHIQSDETEEFDAILRRQKPGCRSLLEELREKLPDVEILYAYGYPIAGEDQSQYDQALKAVQDADIAILTLGGKHGTCSMASMGEGVDASDINLPPCQDEFIKKAAKLHTPLAGVHFNGRPISSDAADQYLDAILEAWNPSETGAEAIVSVLLGEYDPGGKLPVSVAFHAGQIPIYYNHPNGSAWHQAESIGFVNYVDLPHTPRYFFGHGLSYTTFAYSGLKIGAEEICADESVRIEAVIANSGDRAGDEVVQLYLTDRYASMTRPVKELAGFKRISLQPGEKKKVIFEVAASQMAFLDKDMRWKVEKGAIGVEVGSSSEDIRLAGEYKVKNNAWVKGRDRAFYANVFVEQAE